MTYSPSQLAFSRSAKVGSGERGISREMARAHNAFPAPKGKHHITLRPDVELSEAAKTLARERDVPYGDALCVVLAEDPALASRYEDWRYGHTALMELAERVEMIRGADLRKTTDKARAMALAEDAVLKAGVDAWFTF